MRRGLVDTFLLSSALFLVSGSSWAHGIAVSKPDANTLCVAGQECAVRWSVQNVEDVKIQIRLSGEKEWTVAVEKTKNTGEYKWVVSKTIRPGTYKVLVVSTKDGEVHGVSQEFKISQGKTPSYGTKTSFTPNEPIFPSTPERNRTLWCLLVARHSDEDGAKTPNSAVRLRPRDVAVRNSLSRADLSLQRTTLFAPPPLRPRL